MRWSPGGRSSDIEDRRGGGGMGGLRMGGGLGLGGIVILLLLSFVFKKNFFTLLSTDQAGAPTTQSNPVDDPAEEPQVQFVSFVLDDAQKTWTGILAERGVDYPRAKLVLFRDAVQSACGVAESASGPFYCPGDQKAYIDLSFYDELKQRFDASGDFAQAYVLAHEIGHHVQNVLGIERKVRAAMQQNPSSRNALSVRMELQADCFAGIWGHSTEQRNILEAGDVDEALNAAAAIGDDRIQKMSGRGVSPDSFTHGSSEQRAYWFKQGFQSGRLEACDTFNSSR
ncbi:MAG TPA: neutral zinc metallopeptidase [Terriglobales bacterium]|nr:neutral zinc metallopeptidase [Terriglobales bacterium]